MRAMVLGNQCPPIRTSTQGMDKEGLDLRIKRRRPIRGATGSEAGTGAGPSRQWHWSHRMTDTSLVYRDPSSPIRDRGCPAFRRV